MVTKNATRKKAQQATSDNGQDTRPLFCSVPKEPERVFAPGVDLGRQALIRMSNNKWTNGTVLHYYFFDQATDGEAVVLKDGSNQWLTWTASEAEKDIVRQAFEVWKAVGVGLDFEEVTSRDAAEIRIGFMQGDGHWSAVGRHILARGRDQRTMNFGQQLTQIPNGIDTAVHEIGHTIGFKHEHQNPKAGIVWNEPAVYAYFAQKPNEWDRDKVDHNILTHLPAHDVSGSNWDPDSIMHYRFDAGLIKAPRKYRNGLQPAPGLSDRDRAWVQRFYPPLGPDDYTLLQPFRAVPLDIRAGDQMNFIIKPDATRTYEIKTFGELDAVAVLFEEIEGRPVYLTADDNSGTDLAASLRVKLLHGRRYILRLRLYYAERATEAAIMIW